ncbi:MAG TPA: 4Fe-4S dicluster domain-containing protein [Methanospirillum sp.]|nr:4Fe-4S dicluster domain-containing protein [Methanospirillum sp.]
MKIGAKIRSYGKVISHLFHKPVTVRESFGFIAANSRGLPRRDESRCTGCGACNERCSSGATSIMDDQGQRTVSIDGLRCIFCARCADVCPEGALDLTFGSLIHANLAVSSEKSDILGESDQPCLCDPDIDIVSSRRYAQMISLSHTIQENLVTVDTTFVLQKCRVCGEQMPVSEKNLQVIQERMLTNLQPDNAAIIRKDMELYLTACISCRRTLSLTWNTHPRKFI